MDMFSKKFSSKLHAEELEPKDPFCIKYPIYCDVIYTLHSGNHIFKLCVRIEIDGQDIHVYTTTMSS